MAAPSIWVEVWPLPHVTPFEAKIAQLPITSLNLRDVTDGIGHGQVSIPADYSRLAEVVEVVPGTPASNVASILRVRMEGVTDPIFEFPAGLASIPLTEPAGQVLELAGGADETFLDWEIVYPFDAPAYPSLDPDWIWGGDSLLADGGYEGTINEVQNVSHDGTGGTFTLTFGAETTGAIAWNTGTVDMELALQALTNITDVRITGLGTAASPWAVEWVNPSGDVAQLTGSAAGLTPGGSTITITTETTGGGQVPEWQATSSGTQTSISPRIVTGQARTGTHSLEIDPAPPSPLYAGAEVPLPVVPGATYYGELWAKTADADTADRKFKLVARGPLEELLGAWHEQVLPVSVYTKHSIQWTQPASLSIAIFRYAFTGAGTDPLPVYVDDATVAQGRPAATPGAIVLELLGVAQGKGGLPFIRSASFTAGADSDGVAWNASISFTAQALQTLGQVLENLRIQGYEWTVRWNAGAAQYDLLLYNPGGLGTDRSAAETPILTQGANVAAGELHKTEPKGSVVFVMSVGGFWTEAVSSPLETVYGRRVQPVAAITVGDGPAATRVAVQAALDDLDRMASAKLVCLPTDQSIPYRDFNLGDKLQVQLPGLLATTAMRVVAITTKLENERLWWEVDVGAQVFRRVPARQGDTRRKSPAPVVPWHRHGDEGTGRK